MSQSLPPGYFDRLYSENPDPWNFAGSDYERAKYAATLQALPHERFDAGLEIGCSIGVLTRQLAARCESLIAVDVAETALAEARRRCAGAGNIAFKRLRMPEHWPDGVFDLILFSEVLYYLSRADLEQAAERTRASLRTGGAVLLVHYTLPTDYPLSGDEAADGFIAASEMTVSLQRREAEYRLDLLAG